MDRNIIRCVRIDFSVLFQRSKRAAVFYRCSKIYRISFAYLLLWFRWIIRHRCLLSTLGFLWTGCFECWACQVFSRSGMFSFRWRHVFAAIRLLFSSIQMVLSIVNGVLFDKYIVEMRSLTRSFIVRTQIQRCIRVSFFFLNKRLIFDTTRDLIYRKWLKIFNDRSPQFPSTFIINDYKWWIRNRNRKL